MQSDPFAAVRKIKPPLSGSCEESCLVQDPSDLSILLSGVAGPGIEERGSVLYAYRALVI